MKSSIETLAERFNQFDTYYMMSDSHSKWTKWNNEEKELSKAVKSLRDTEKISLVSLLNENGKSHTVGLELVAYVDKIHTNKVSIKSTVMSTAWAMIREGIFTNMSDALRAAWKRIKLIIALKKGVAYFAYSKSTGELREAIGTLSKGLFTYESKSNKKDIKVHVVKYFDLEANAFRSCRVDRLINIKAA